MEFAYDTIPYPTRPYPRGHPDRMAVLGTLFGMHPKPVAESRVLEIGCGDGANLIPMAHDLPGSRFVGIDLAEQPIARARQLAGALGLENVEFHAQDLQTMGEEFGQFDYIVAHGVFSWVPLAVREKLLALCRLLLAPQGIAFVSYNAYPGAHLRRMLRDMMLFHIRSIPDPRVRSRQARALLRFIVESQTTDTLFAKVVRHEYDRLEQLTDEYIFHDDLSENNQPYHFYQFVGRAVHHRLQFLAEADYFEMQAADLPESAHATLKELEDNLLAREQYLDFLRGRSFRLSLLCRDDVALDRDVAPERLRPFFVGLTPRPQPKPEDPPEQEDVPEPPADLQALMEELEAAFPAPIPFEELERRVAARAGEEGGRLLGERVLWLYARNLVELRLRHPGFTNRISERPVASALARFQARQSDEVTSLRHENIMLSGPAEQQLIQLLDGRHDRAALLERMRAWVDAGDIVLRVPPGEDALDRLIEERLDEYLRDVSRHGLLVA